MRPEEWMKEAEVMGEQIIADRRYLHMHPEIGFELQDTISYVEKRLSEMGYQPEKCGKAGLVVTVGERKTGKVFLIRADMDALPIQEESEVEFASKNGKMHACGHDMHTAMLLGAARILKKHEDEISGTIKMMFQPAEEILEGAKDMVESGVLQNPDVDGAMMIHVMAGMSFPEGTVLVSAPGVSAPAADYFEINVKGKGCHGAMPNMGIDPLNAAAHILIGLQEIHARELAIGDKAALTIGMIQAGTTANVIPDEVVMKGSLRAFDEETRSYIKERMQKITQGIANAFRAEAEIVYGSGCPTLLNNEHLSVKMEKYVKDLVGEEYIVSVAKLTVGNGGKKGDKMSGSEDFAYVSHEVPSVMLALAAGCPENGYVYPQHHPKVQFDEKVLPIGSAVYAYTAIRWLQESD